MHEHRFIGLLRAMATDPSARGLQDDAAVVAVGSEALVLTHDMMVEGTHYFPDADPADVAWKLVARNLSDLAAKGAAPLGVLLGYMLGDDDWDRGFAAGLAQALSHYDTKLWGGDTSTHARGRADAPRVIGMTALGRATHQPVPSRAGAQIGDSVWIAGTIGDAYLGWTTHDVRHNECGHYDIETPEARAEQEASAVHQRYQTAFLRPVPLLAEGRALAAHVTAMMDISDGVLLDASRLAEASRCTIDLDFDTLPFSDDFRATWDTSSDSGNHLDVQTRNHASRYAAATFGDDYALLFTLPNGVEPRCPATCVGQVRAPKPGQPLLINGAAPTPTKPLGWEHRPD
jgi:thiamine-monophosphate kinase